MDKKHIVMYAGLTGTRGRSDRQWRVDLAIPRTWPLSVMDRFQDRKAPVRTFVGNGKSWFEVVGDSSLYVGAGKFVPMLNSIVANRALELLAEAENS